MAAPPNVDRMQLVSTFLQGWSLERLLRHWLDEVSDLGLSLRSLVQTVPIFARTAAQEQGEVRERRLEWWPRSSVELLRRSLEERAAEPALSALETSGQSQTVEYLLEAAGDPERTAAVLLSASLFKRIESARTAYPRDAWPHFSIAQTLLRQLRAQYNYRWDATCTATLPAHDVEAGLVITSMEQFVRFLAVEHARVLHRWAPVQIRWAEEPVQRHSLTRIRAGAEADEAQEPVTSMRQRWFTLDKPELEALIWSKPQREIAREFGVSEATVAKRCKALGIEKPARGFWHRSLPPAAKRSASVRS
jgi:hypothetical protein